MVQQANTRPQKASESASRNGCHHLTSHASANQGNSKRRYGVSEEIDEKSASSEAQIIERLANEEGKLAQILKKNSLQKICLNAAGFLSDNSPSTQPSLELKQLCISASKVVRLVEKNE